VRHLSWPVLCLWSSCCWGTAVYQAQATAAAANRETGAS
jgi:hypothetical protein